MRRCLPHQCNPRPRNNMLLLSPSGFQRHPRQGVSLRIQYPCTSKYRSASHAQLLPIMSDLTSIQPLPRRVVPLPNAPVAQRPDATDDVLYTRSTSSPEEEEEEGSVGGTPKALSQYLPGSSSGTAALLRSRISPPRLPRGPPVSPHIWFFNLLPPGPLKPAPHAEASEIQQEQQQKLEEQHPSPLTSNKTSSQGCCCCCRRGTRRPCSRSCPRPGSSRQ